MAKRELVRIEESKSLSAIQEQAILLLAGGATVTAAAEALGVTRQTVSTWANRDPEFVAALNLVREETLEAGADRVRGLMAKALDAVEAAFEGEELTVKERAALGMELLKQLKVTDAASRCGETSPAAIRQSQALQDMIDGVAW